MKIVEIQYKDITDNSQEPLSYKEFLEKDCKICHCIGFLAKETEDAIWLIQDYDIEEKKDVWGMIIPTTVIVKRAVICEENDDIF